MNKAETKHKFDVFQNRRSVKETMEIFTQVISRMYEQDPKHKIDDPMEHILREIGVEPPKKFLDGNEDLTLLKEENEELKLQVDRLETTLDELQQELQNVRRMKKM